MTRLQLAILAILACAASAPAAHAASPVVPGEVVVGYADGSTAVRPTVPGDTVRETARALERRPDVTYAVPNHIAHASYVPNDPGRGGAGNWQRVQWNFLAGNGVDAPGAWSNLLRARRPGGRGVIIAVLDTGVAFRNAGRFRRSPDFRSSQFTRGYDFVGGDRYPDDQFGHGTFVAGLIAERVNNGVGLTGLAYGARIMPVRVLDAQGYGNAATIARGIRYAASHGAKIINMSLEFDAAVPASEIPEILAAVNFANRRQVLVVGAAGNASEQRVAYPARASHVISVGATTEHGCQADYSNDGPGLDIAAPGGGADAPLDEDPVHCHPSGPSGRDVFQLTFAGSIRRFGLPGGYQGTSMAAPHVSATAALVIASGVIGRNPSPAAIERRLKATAHDLGPPGPDVIYGAGLLDAAAATAPLR